MRFLGMFLNMSLKPAFYAIQEIEFHEKLLEYFPFSYMEPCK